MSSNTDFILNNNLQLTTVSVIGISSPVVVNPEYTLDQIASAYNTFMSPLATVFQLQIARDASGNPIKDSNGNLMYVDPNNPSGPPLSGIARISPTLVTQVQQGIQDLLTLAQNPIEDPPGSNKFYGLTTLMANNLDQVLRTLRSIGWDGNPTSITADLLNKWKDLSVLTSAIGDVMAGAANAIAANHSLQASIETIYVKEANDLINQQLTSMETALQASQGALDTLSSLQNIHNELVVSGKGSINFVYLLNGRDQNQYASQYLRAASAHFGQPIIPHIPSTLVQYGSPPVSPSLAALQTAQTQLKNQIQSALDVQQQSIDQINSIINNPNAQQALALYNQAVATYNNADKSTDALKLAAQQALITSANAYNQIFWQGRLWQGDPLNPASPLVAPTTFPPLSYKILQNGVLTTVTDTEHPGPFANLADYINEALHFYNGKIRDAYNNQLNNFNDNIDQLNATIDAYNQSNPGATQLPHYSKFGDGTPRWKEVDGWDFGNFVPKVGSQWAVDDGSENVQKFVTSGSATFSDKDLFPNPSPPYNTIFGNGPAAFGAGIVTPNNPYPNNPFSAVNPKPFDSLNATAVDTIPTLQTDSGLKIQNPITGVAGAVDQEGRPILTPVSFTQQGFQVFQQLLQTRNKLMSELVALQASTPKVPSGAADGHLTFDPNSLYSKIQAVLNDMNKNLTANGAGPVTATSPQTAQLQAFNRWMLDNYDKAVNAQASQAGAMQQNITFAIVAAQSLNDSQKSNVQNFMFVFEEYYKSASAILTTITDLINKISQGISR